MLEQLVYELLISELVASAFASLNIELDSHDLVIEDGTVVLLNRSLSIFGLLIDNSRRAKELPKLIPVKHALLKFPNFVKQFLRCSK